MIDLDHVRTLRDETEHQAALAAVEALLRVDPEPDSEQGARLQALALLVEEYENRVWPIGPATPLEVLKFMMEQNGRTQADLGRLLNSRSRASEILSGKKSLTLDQIRLLSREWRIPAGALVGELEPA